MTFKGGIDPTALPRARCRAASPKRAPAACGGARVGDGTYRARTGFPEQEAFASSGHIIAFHALRRASMRFADGRRLASTLTRGCRVSR